MASDTVMQPIRSIPYVALDRHWDGERDEILNAVERVFTGAAFISGDAVRALEKDLADYCGTRYAIALNSGTDALMLGMRALGIGPGDEVITPPNSFVASAASIALIGATPVFADVLDDQNIDPDAVAGAITPRTRAIMPVHLTGRMAAMDKLCDLAERHGLMIIEDAAQSIGSSHGGRRSGSLGDIGCFSAHPLKNLNAAGDAGFITTNREDVRDRVMLQRNHGMVDRNIVVEFGGVSRMDTLQAEILRIRLRRLDEVIARRRANAALYRSLLPSEAVFMPPCRPEEFNTFHTFVIQVEDRDGLQSHLAAHGVGTAIHYPIPIHLQPAAAGLGHKAGDFPNAERQASRILTLPIHQFLNDDDVHYIAGLINGFYNR